jgi:hypothetical protein
MPRPEGGVTAPVRSPYRILVPLLALVAALTTLVSAAAPAAGSPILAAVKPVIGRPVTVPARPLPGQRFAISFRVTRSDTGAPLLRGRMLCDPSVAGRTIRHVESFTAGNARLSFVVPVEAQGRQLKIRVAIASGGQSASRTSLFAVASLPKPSLSVGDASVVEGNGGSTALSFPVTLSAATRVSVSTRYATSDGAVTLSPATRVSVSTRNATSDGAATAGSDYTPASGTIMFAPGQTIKAIVVTVAGDDAVEPDETLTLTLSAPINATLADGTATGTIVNDDVPARSGHYTGSTSQWKFIAFDVSEGARTITGLFFFVDLSCDTPLGIVRNMKMEILDSMNVAPDGSFAVDASGTHEEVFAKGTVAGRLVAPGSANGTLRLLDVTSKLFPFNSVHCWTDEVTWNAK